MTAIYETCVCGIIFSLTPTIMFKLLYKFSIIHRYKLLNIPRLLAYKLNRNPYALLPYLDLTQTILNIKVNVSIKCKIEGN